MFKSLGSVFLSFVLEKVMYTFQGCIHLICEIGTKKVIFD